MVRNLFVHVDVVKFRSIGTSKRVSLLIVLVTKPESRTIGDIIPKHLKKVIKRNLRCMSVVN
jgi:hypothetical protein